jgi:methionyl-tRNA formyltransferase
MSNIKIIGFLAREHGLATLKDIIKEYPISRVYTHRYEPGSNKTTERKEFKEFHKICYENKIPLFLKTEEDYYPMFDERAISVSWRRRIPPQYKGINIHRGKLPEYAGGEPIKKALINKEEYVTITCHVLRQEIDKGEKLLEYEYKVNYDNNRSLEENIERTKREITPLYPIIALKGIEEHEKRFKEIYKMYWGPT